MKTKFTFDANGNIIDANGNIIITATQASTIQSGLVPAQNATAEQIISIAQQQDPQQQQYYVNQSRFSVDDNKQRLFSKIFSWGFIALGSTQLIVGGLLGKNILSVIYNVNENSTSAGVFLSTMAILLITKGVVGLKKDLAGFEVNFWVNLLDVVIFGLIAITNIGVNNVSNSIQEAAKTTQQQVSNQAQKAAKLVSPADTSKDWMDGLRYEAKIQYGINKNSTEHSGYEKTDRNLTQKGYFWCKEEYTNKTLDEKGFLNCSTGFIWKSAS